MKRRDLLKWSTPVVIAVVIPAHALTSEISVTSVPPIDPPTLPPVDEPPVDEPPVDEPPVDDGPCKDGKVLICHHEKDNQFNDLCVAEPAVSAHVKNHNDYLGACK